MNAANFLCKQGRFTSASRFVLEPTPADAPRNAGTSRRSAGKSGHLRNALSGFARGSPRLFVDRDRSFDGFLTPEITCGCQRFQTQRLDGLLDKPGRGRKTSLLDDAVSRVLEQVIQPRIGEPRWRCRRMARAAGDFGLQHTQTLGRQSLETAPSNCPMIRISKRSTGM